jgi:hypothetical protein
MVFVVGCIASLFLGSRGVWVETGENPRMRVRWKGTCVRHPRKSKEEAVLSDPSEKQVLSPKLLSNACRKARASKFLPLTSRSS